jgi:hypothetical protein
VLLYQRRMPPRISKKAVALWAALLIGAASAFVVPRRPNVVGGGAASVAANSGTKARSSIDQTG